MAEWFATPAIILALVAILTVLVAVIRWTSRVDHHMAVFGEALSELREENKSIRQEIKEFRTEHKQDIKGVRSDIKQDIEGVRSNVEEFRAEHKRDIERVRSDVKQDIKGFRAEHKQDIAGVRQEVEEFKAEHRQDIAGVRQEVEEFKAEHRQDIAGVRQEIEGSRAEHRQDIAGFRVELKQDAQGLREEVRQDIREVRQDLKTAFLRLGMEPVSGSSPLRLTEFGERIAADFGAKAWAAGVAPQLRAQVKDFEPFEIDEFCNQYVQTKLSEQERRRVSRCAYTFGIEAEGVHKVLRVVLRDALLAG